MDEKGKPPENQPATGTAEGPTEQKRPGTVAVTDNAPLEGTDGLPAAAGNQQDTGPTTKHSRQLPAVPPIKQQLLQKPKGVNSQKKDHPPSDRMKLRSSDTDRFPAPDASDKGNNKTSTTDIDNPKATSDVTRTRADMTVTGQSSVSGKNIFVKHLTNQFESSTNQQKHDVSRGTVEKKDGRDPAITHITKVQPLVQTDDEVTISKQDKPEGMGAQTDDMDKHVDAHNKETQPSGQTSTRDNKDFPTPTPSSGEPTTSRQTQRSLNNSELRLPSNTGKNKPEVVHTDESPDEHNLERQPSGHTSNRDDKVTNPKQVMATDIGHPMREQMRKQHHRERNPDSPGPLKDLTGEPTVQLETSYEAELDTEKGEMEDKAGSNNKGGDGDTKMEESNVKKTGSVNESVELKLADAAFEDTKTEEDHVKTVNTNDKDKRQVVDLKGDKDKIEDPNLTESIKKDGWVYVEGEKKAKAKEKTDDVEGVSDDSCEKISDEEEKDLQNIGAVSIQPPVASMIPTNNQKEVNQLEEKPNIIIDQAELKHVGKFWLLTVGKKSIQLPKEINDARVEGKFLVADDNVIYEIHNNQGDIVLKSIEKANIQKSHVIDQAEQQTKRSEEQSRVSDPPKEKCNASNTPDRGSKENNQVKPKTRALTPSINETLHPNVEMKDENEDTEDRDVSTIALDDLTNRMTNVSLQEKNDDVECSNSERSMSQTATKRIIEKQTVKATGQDSTVVKTRPDKSDVTHASFSVSARENASAKLMSHKARNKSQSFDETAEVGENDMKQFEKSRSGEQSDKKPSLQPEFNNSEKEKDTDQASSATPAIPPRHKHGKQIPSGQDQLTPSNEQTVKYEGASSGPNRGASGPASMGGEVIEKKLKCQISYKDNKECVSLETDLETYMKLKYNLNNPKWLCQKQKNLNDQYPGMRIGYERHMDVMIINLDVNKPLGIQPAIVDDVVKALLQTTDHLFVNSVAIGGIDKIQAVELINQHNLVKDKDLYVECDNDLDHLHYVCPHNVRTLVDVLVQITVKQLSGPKKSRKFNMVYKEIFEKTNILEKIKSENRPLQVSLLDENDDEFVCVLKGCNEDVTWAESQIHTEIVEGHGFASFKIKDIKHSDEFESLELSDLVEETLKNKTDSNVVDHFNKDGTISICGPTQGNVDKCVSTIKHMLISKSLPIENKEISLTQLEKYIEELQNTTYTHITILGVDPYTVTFVGHKDSIESVEAMLLEKINPKLLEKINPILLEKIDPKKDKVKPFKISDNETELLNEGNKVSELTCENKQIWIKYREVFTHICAKENLPQLAKMHDIKPSKLEVKETTTWQGFWVTGGIHQYNKLKEYLSQYGCDNIALIFNDSENMPEVFHEVERKHNVTLNVEDNPGPTLEDSATGGSADATQVAEAVAEKEANNMKWIFQGGHCLMVVNDDATNCWQDMLVDIHIIETGKSSDLQVHDAGQNRKRTSIDVNQWKDGQNKEKESFQKEMERMLNLAQAYDCKDICIPIATVGNWPLKKYITQILYTVNEHLQKTGMIPVNIKLCTADKTAYTECCNAARKAIPLEVMSRQTQKSGTSPKFNIKRIPFEVNVIKGSLHKIKADVIVNTTNHNLHLDTGAVSKSLLKEAGIELQQECSRKYPDKIMSGQIVETGGHQLRCDYVFHSALDNYNGSAESIKQLVMDCLKKAGANKCKSIAFPAIGTGNLSYPKHEVAVAMFEGVYSYEQKYSGSSVEKVDFVIYSGDQEAVRLFKDHQVKYKRKIGKVSTTYEQNESTTIQLGRINVKARLGTLSNCTTEAIVYLWEKKEYHDAKFGEHPLLKDAGKVVQKQFEDHRTKDGTSRYKVFSTPGGSLPFSVIVHAPCCDNKDNIANALRNSLYLLDEEKIKTASVCFPTQHPLLKHGDKLPEVVVAAVKEVQQSVVCLSDICIVVEGRHNFPKIFQYFRSKGDEKNVTIKIIGKQKEIERAKEALQHYAAPGNSETIPEDDNPRSPTFTHIAPVAQNIQRGIEDDYAPGAPGKNPEILDRYVAIENIPSDYTLEKLGAALFAARIPIKPPALVYIDGSTHGIAICDSKQAANQLVQFKGIPRILFKEQPKVLIEPTCTIKCNNNNKQFIMDQLQNILVTVQDQGDNRLLIVAQTTYQMQFAKTLCPESTSNVRHQSDSVLVETIKVIPEVWKIVKHVKNENYQVLEDNASVNVCIKDNIVTIEWMAAACDDDETGNSVEVLKACCRSLEGKEIEEILLDGYDEEKTQRWCNEVQDTLEKNCCLYIPKQKKVFAYCDTYDDIQKVKHQFMVKEGKVRPTGRRKRNIEVSEPSSASGQTDYSSKHTEDQPNFEKRRHNDGNKFNWISDAKNVKEYKTREGIVVKVYEASIVKLPVDCIVNAANDTLQHGGGIARVIEKAAGYELKREGNAYIKKYGKIPVGRQCTTNAGNLPYNCVIHAVGPRWDDYRPHDLKQVQEVENLLYSAITNSFDAAERRQLDSIAVPAISAAIFAVPEELCVYQYAKAISDYSKHSTSALRPLREIHFIDINPSIIRKIQHMFKLMIADSSQPNYDSNKFVKSHLSGGNTKWYQSEYTNDGSLRSNNTEDAPAGFGNQAYNVHTNENVPLLTLTEEKDVSIVKCGMKTIRLHENSMFTIEAKAIVSVEDRYGKGTGKLAREIHSKINERVMKTKYEEEKRTLFPSSLKLGDTPVSNGCGSGYVKIVHAVLPYTDAITHSAYQRKQLIMLTFDNILAAAENNDDISSIVMPLIGAGSEPGEIKIAAGAFVDSFIVFCNKHTDKKLDIHLVLRTTDDRQTVRTFFKNHATASTGSKHKHEQPKSPPNIDMKTSPTQNPTTAEQNDLKEKENCVICMDDVTDPETLDCGHMFCKECIEQQFKHKPACPTCGALCGTITGDQPSGTMNVTTNYYSQCAGYRKCGSIIIQYEFPPGKQQSNHPAPGKYYKGMHRTAYLPDNSEGRQICEMLKVAFDRKLVFTIGNSRTTGQEGVITWNDIHHKTDHRPNTQFGYPDPTYFDRVKDELSAKGITEKDIQKK